MRLGTVVLAAAVFVSACQPASDARAARLIPWRDLPAPKEVPADQVRPYRWIEVSTEEVPRQVKIGGTARFVVVLRNPGDRDFPLRPCPVYRVAYGESGTVVDDTGRLNCAAAPRSIPPDGTVRLEMKLKIEQIEHLGPGFVGSFHWSLLSMRGVGTSAGEVPAVA